MKKNRKNDKKRKKWTAPKLTRQDRLDAPGPAAAYCP